MSASATQGSHNYSDTVTWVHMVFYYGHVLRKDENDWVKKFTDFEVEGVRLTGQRKLGVRLYEKIV